MTRIITGAAFVSLDGVIQAPGGPTEDPTGGFDHGGWMAPLGDALIDETLGTLFTPPYELLLGRRTYDIFAAYWPYVTGEEAAFARALNTTAKHVLTHSEAPLAWDNSHRLATIDAIADLKGSDGPDLLIQGSSTLYPQLLYAGLIDRLVLMIFPVVLGHGKRLFDGAEGARTLRMTGHEVSPGGVIVARYEPAGPIQSGTFLTHEPSEAEHARRRAMAEGRW